jgi:hypothetical protein
MQEHVDEVSYYYDLHPTPEDLMGETAVHAVLIHYLVDVLRWLFREQRCAVYENLNFYRTSNAREYPLAPDIAVIKGVSYQDIRSWRVSKSGPPQVVLEILVANEGWLRLYDREGHLRLTGEEARTQQAEIEARRAQAEARRAEQEARRAETEAQRAEQEARRAETEARRARALAEKLRALGIDPDQISYSS